MTSQGNNWVLTTLVETHTLAYVNTALLVTVCVVCIATLLLRLLGRERAKQDIAAAKELIAQATSLLTIAKSYQDLGHAHKEDAKQVLATVQRGVETLSNAANETKQAATDVLAEVLARRAERQPD